MNHTPTPWTIEDPMCDDLWIVEADKEAYEWRCIASVQATPPDEGPELSRVEMRANAHLIVGAVNSLDDIIITLKHAHVFITSREKMHPEGVRQYEALLEKLSGLVPEPKEPS